MTFLLTIYVNKYYSVYVAFFYIKMIILHYIYRYYTSSSIVSSLLIFLFSISLFYIVDDNLAIVNIYFISLQRLTIVINYNLIIFRLFCNFFKIINLYYI